MGGKEIVAGGGGGREGNWGKYAGVDRLLRGSCGREGGGGRESIELGKGKLKARELSAGGREAAILPRFAAAPKSTIELEISGRRLCSRGLNSTKLTVRGSRGFD
jgi:hypothetical protein